MNRYGKRCVLYPRVSTEMQVDGYSLEGQKNMLTRFADREEMIVVDTYEDAGKSGKSIEGRPAFQKMLRDIEDGLDIDYILVYKLSRFGRNAADILNSLELVQSYGVNLICIEEGIDSSQTSGKLLISVLSAVAEIERENIIEQTMNGRREKARQGGWNGGFAPYGYTLEDNKLMIEETEAVAIRKIFELYTSSEIGLGGIANQLNLQGIRKIPRQNGTLEDWTGHFIKLILDNPVYCGKIAYGRRTKEKVKGTKNDYQMKRNDDYILTEGQHKGIVSEEVWEKAHAKRLRTGVKQPSKIGRDRVHLLSGLLKCPVCGSPMYTNKHAWTNKDGTYKEIYYYVCSRNRMVRGKHCEYKAMLKKTDIEPMVIEAIREIVRNEEYAQAIKKRIGVQIDTKAVDKELEGYQAKLKEVDLNKTRLEREIDSLPADAKYRERKLHDMTLRLDSLYDVIVELEEKIEDARLRRDAIKQQAITLENIYKIMVNFDCVYNIINDEEKRNVVTALIKEIEIYRNDESEYPLKRIGLNFPVFKDGGEVTELLWDKGNTVELYSVQRYLQYDTLAQNSLQHFDSWASTFGETVTALELAPEGTNYRAKTRFAKFYNLPELMQMFREVADIQTADMLKLPVPKVNYHNIKTKPSDIQTEMVASFAKRAEKVRARLVEPNIDNMLKITNDGRKLALDQRMIDPMLPDDPDSKVNACVDNMYRIWEEHADTKATQLVFCDLSTPKNDGTFNVYDDMREKLIARGIPAEQVRFIHEATTDAQKKELFGKVRSGEVRVLFGSTPKMGAGTNVQDRLIAIHNLDCPWRPSDLEQRQGRIERQGNMFPEVEVYRYVTEQTFDAYLYQLVESKQKFISQIMTSKSPVRSAEDVDEVALSFAEVKMLATGDARFKEKMDLDIQVSKLRVLKQSYLSEHYDLEDRILKFYPQTIKEYEERIAGYESDAALAEQHKPQGEDKFCPMTIKGVTFTEKAVAGEMLLAVCKENTLANPVEIGSYRGFRMEVYYDTLNTHYCLNLCGKAKHKVDLGADALGNLTRIENELSKLPARLEAAKTKKAETIAQLETAKEEIKKPFAFEDELKEKTERLNALNIELNLNEKDTSVMDTEPEQTEEQPERKCASRER